MKLVLLQLLMGSAFATELIKPDFSDQNIRLNIVQAYSDSFETYTLVNHNSREMLLVCANNRAYRFNKRPYIEYRNFYNIRVAKFYLSDNYFCKNLAKFIEAAHMAIDEEDSIQITLSRRDMSVSKITYPNIDPLSDTGELKDLYSKKRVKISSPTSQNTEFTEQLNHGLD